MNRIEFSDLTIDLDVFQMSRNGEIIPIGARPLDLLVYLVQHRERVVSQEDLRRDVWHSASLSDAAIPTCVMELRRILNDDAANPKYIQSIRSRGYKFIGDACFSGSKTRVRSRQSAELQFVGRNDELDMLAAAVQSVRSGSPAKVYLLVGEAGSGKTRFLAEFIASLRGKTRSFHAKAPSINGTPPFWPWTQLLNSALQDQHDPNSRLCEAALPLARIFPEIQVPPTTEEDTVPLCDRFEIFSQWTKVVRVITSGEPTVLTFEDIHRADSDSQSLLYWICDELANDPVLLIATHRPFPLTDQAVRILSEIENMPHAISLALGPLSEPDVRNLIDPSYSNRNSISRSLIERTGGNAFYVTHLVQHLDELPDLMDSFAVCRTLPLNGREIVIRHLSDLPDSVRGVLSEASVLGDQFSLGILSKMLDLDPKHIASALEPAERALLVQRRGADYLFRHTILRDGLYQLLGPSRRRELHLAAARALQDKNDGRTRIAQISDHLTESLPHGSLSEAVSLALAAGRDAASRFALARARTYFERALQLLESSPDATRTQRYDVLVELAVAALYDSDRDVARNLFLEAAQIAREDGSPEKIARCALEMSPDFLSIEVGTHDETLISLLEESIATLRKDDLSTRARCLARLSQARHWNRTHEKNELMATQSARLARESGDGGAIIASCFAMSDSMNRPQRARDRLHLLQEIEATVSRAGDKPAKLLHKTRVLAAHLELGDVRRVETINDQYRVIAAQTGLPQYKWMPIAHDCMLATMRGDLDVADNLAKEYTDVSGENPDENVIQTFALQFAWREIERNRSDKILPLALDMSTNRKAVLGWQTAVPFIQWDLGLIEDARTSLNEFSESDIVEAQTDIGGGLSIAMLSEVAAHLDEKKYLKILWKHVSEITDHFATAGYGMLYMGSFARCAGLVANALGDSRTAIELVTEAVERENRRGALSCRMRAELDLLQIRHGSDLIATSEATTRISNIRTEAASHGLRRIERCAVELQAVLNNFSLTLPVSQSDARR